MNLLWQNEKEANILVAKVMRITFIIFTLIYLLNMIGVFTIDDVVMTIAYIGGGCLLLLPTLLVNGLKKECDYIKYLNVVCASVFVTVISITLTYHVVAIYVYPIAIASLYFSRKLNIFATVFTVAGVSIGQILAFYLKTVQDENFIEISSVLVFGVIPRALVLIAVAAIFTMLCSRTAAMLSDLIGALEHTEQMKDNAIQTSETMLSMVKELSEITEESLQANQMIVEESEHLLMSSTENTGAVENTDHKIQDIAVQLKELSKMNSITADLTEQINENTQDNQKRMEDVTVRMEQIHGSTNDCKQMITNLGEESRKIIGIVEMITQISDQINILALNATIEAARAGEHGKGFAVVAGEIQQLSEQTKNSIENIGRIVRQVVDNTKDSIKAMEQNTTYTQKGIDSIHKANKSAMMITESNEKLAGQLREIRKAAQIIQEKSDEVADNMKQIRNNTQQNCNAVERVSVATQKNSIGTESLVEIVEQIKGLSEQLINVVHG